MKLSPVLQEFDSLAASVQARLGCADCLISVPDEDALYALGSSAPEVAAEQRNVLAVDTICQHTMALQHPVKIEDVASTPWLNDVPTVRAFSIGAYLGAPLVLADGGVVGAICALSAQTRDWSDDDVNYLVEMADLVANRIDLRLLQSQENELASCLDETDRIIAALAQSDSCALSVHTRDGELLFANRGMQAQLGLTGTDLLNLPMQDIRAASEAGSMPTALVGAQESDTQTGGSRSGMRVRVDFPDHGKTWLHVGWSQTLGGLMLCDWTPCEGALDKQGS